MCQDMPTSLYKRWDYNEEKQKFSATQNRVRTFENMVVPYVQAIRTECKIESYYTVGTQKKNIASVWIVIGTIVRLFLKQWVVIYLFRPCQEARPILSVYEIIEEPRIEKKMSFKKITFEKRILYRRNVGV